MNRSRCRPLPAASCARRSARSATRRRSIAWRWTASRSRAAPGIYGDSASPGPRPPERRFSPWPRRGADARAGDVLLPAGTRLAAPELAIAASAGHAELQVSRAPRIAILTTGDELVEPGEPILEHQVRRSNAYGLAGALSLAGFAPAANLQLPDREDAISAAPASALEQHDVLVLSGGVSAGLFDFVSAVLPSLVVQAAFHVAAVW